MESPYQKFTRDVLVIGGANILNALSAIIFLPLITKTLGAADYGIWSQVQVITNLVVGFAGLGLPYAMSRFMAANQDKAKIRDELWSVFSLVSLVTLAIAVAFVALSDIIARAFFEGATDIVRITGLIILVSSLNQVFLNFFRALRQMARYALFNVLGTYLQIGLIALLVINGYGLFSMVLAVLAVYLAMFLSLVFLLRKQVGFARPHFTRIKEYLNFGLPTVAGILSGWVVYSSDRLVIAYFLGATSVGIYSAAYGVGSFPLMISAILGFVLPATLSKLYDEGNIEQVKTILRYSLKYVLLAVIPFICGAVILAHPILDLFSTTEIADKGYIILIFESVNAAILISASIFNQPLIIYKKTRISAVAWIIAGLINLGLNIVLVPRLGILGAAIGTLAAYLTAQAIQLYYSLKLMRFPVDWAALPRCVAAAAVMSGLIWLLHAVLHVPVIAVIVCGVVAYGAVLVLVRGFTKNEFLFFAGLLKRK